MTVLWDCETAVSILLHFGLHYKVCPGVSLVRLGMGIGYIVFFSSMDLALVCIT